VLAIGVLVTSFVFNSVDAGGIIRIIVHIILLGGCVWLFVQRLIETWPPTESQARRFKRSLKGSKGKNSNNGGGATGIDDDWPVENEESRGIEKRPLMYELAFGEDETDDDDDSGL
jgi:hypothetical protein